MLDFIQNFIYSAIEFQAKFLRKNIRKNSKHSFVNSTSKRTFAQAASLELSSKTNQNKLKLENNLKEILKKYENNPDKLLAFIRRSGTNVYKIPYADKILKIINIEEGFIPKTKGFKALYINILTSLVSKSKMNFSLTCEPVFILRNAPLDRFYMIQQFHKWYAMKLKLPGFDAESQDNFQKFINQANDDKIKELTIDEILGLKEAIARDVEAINFVVDLAKSTTGSKNALKKMTTGGASV